jgi:hypothetical protein
MDKVGFGKDDGLGSELYVHLVAIRITFTL